METIVLSGVREYCEEMEVSLKIREGRAVIDALNEAGHNGAEVDLLDLLSWLADHPEYAGSFQVQQRAAPVVGAAKRDIPAPVKISVKYEAGHTYDETWMRLDLICPYCGKRNVWGEDSPGDYYMGPSRLCLDCGAGFDGPNGGVTQNAEDLQRLEALRRHNVFT